MFKRNLCIVILSIGLFTGIVSAQDATLPPDVPTAEFATDVPTIEPTVEATLEPTAPPVENPIDATLILPYVGAMAVIAVIGMIVLGGAGLLLLFRSSPAVQFIGRTVAPPLGDAGVAAYEEYARNTPQTFDDEVAKQLRAEWEDFKKRLLVDVSAQVANKVGAELQRQLPSAVSNEVSAQASK